MSRLMVSSMPLLYLKIERTGRIRKRKLKSTDLGTLKVVAQPGHSVVQKL